MLRRHFEQRKGGAVYRSCRPASAAAFLVGVAACGHKQSPSPVQPSAEDQLAALEHGYAVYIMSRFPVAAAFICGSAIDVGLANVDGKLRDHSAQALREEDARLGEFRDKFTALKRSKLSARRRVDRSVALASSFFAPADSQAADIRFILIARANSPYMTGGVRQ
jgi:hypothetical protein